MQEIIQAYTPSPSRYMFDRNKIDWAQLENYGFDKESFSKSKTFDELLKGEKSSFVHPITTADDDGNYQRFYDYISLERHSDGKIGLQIHVPMIIEEVALTPFLGHNFQTKK
jgi:hypothetical protein